MRNILLVLSGPSGVGKGTLGHALLSGGEFVFSVSCTTRAPREGEKEGEAYFFISREEFEARIEKGDFLEYDEHFGYYYGTPRSFVVEKLKEKSVLLDVDVVGALNVKRRYPEAVLVLLAPPDLGALERRLRGRNTEPEEELRRRLSRARFELGEREKFDYVVVNDDVARAEEALRRIIETEKNRS